jgi:hypothetical protein
MPVPGTTTLAPKLPLSVYVTATALPSRSTTEKCVVSSLSLASISVPGAIWLEGVARDESMPSMRDSM